ncbi:hypothetical protein SMICM17S_13153 [Streptomyces microflavus]
MDDHAVGVVGGQGSRERSGVLVDEPPGEVVLDDERPGRPCDRQDLGPAGGGERDPRGFWKRGWVTKTRAPVARNASASSSGRTPSPSIGTGTGRSPLARATASIPG